MSKDAKTKSKGRSRSARRKRRERAELDRQLATKRCRGCLTTGNWFVYSTNGRVRYVQCGGCARRDKVVVHIEDETDGKA